MGGRELVVRKTGAPLDLREMAARTTLREVRQKGHIYVELRRVGKRTIFFCTLCLTQCHNDTVLFDHLGGKMHARRYDAAKATLFGPVPWPFSDGVLFFNPSCEKEDEFSVSGSRNGMSLVIRNGGLGIVGNGDEVDEVSSRFRHNGNGNLNYCENSSSLCRNGSNGASKRKGRSSGDTASADFEIVAYGHKKTSDHNGTLNGTDSCLTIRRVLIKEHVINLRVDLIGLGEIACRIQQTEEGRRKIGRIWCAWLGQGDSSEEHELLTIPKCDFAIVAFSYSYDLGRRSSLDDPNPVHPSLCAGSFSETEDSGCSGKKRKKSFSDPEDSSDSLTNRSSSSSSQNANGSDHLQSSRLISSKAIRCELRKRKRLASEKICDICAQPMLPGKDVGTLLNCKTGNLACRSRNTNGAFHMFHVSCLIHWILLCDSEIRNYQLSNVKPARGRKAKGALKKFVSVFCPECQGTGKPILRDELEKPTVPLTEMFLHKLKAIKAHKSWMKDPEALQRCSAGLHFPDFEEKLKEEVTPVKLLRFYRADV